MTTKSKRRGYNAEVGIVKRWMAHGIKCHRVVLSGALKHLGDEFNGDVKAIISDQQLTIQSKYLANGWATLYGQLENHDCLIVKAKHKEALVILPESLFLSLLGEEGDAPQLCEACGESYTGKHWCLVIENNPELASRIAASKARRKDP